MFGGPGSKTAPMPEWYAATFPVEHLRMTASDVMIETDQARPKKLLVCDVSRACFYAPSMGPVYVTITNEDWEE